MENSEPNISNSTSEVIENPEPNISNSTSEVIKNPEPNISDSLSAIIENPEPNISDSTSEIIEDSDNDTHTNKNKKKREINNKGDGHKGWECLYCNEQNPRASDMNMNSHLALSCKKVPLNIKQELLRKFPVPNQKRKTEIDIITGAQPRIDTKFQVINKMDSGQEELSILRNEITRFMINKGGLKSSVCSRWSSAYDCVQSVLNLEVCIKQILEDDNLALTLDLRKLVRNRQFWTNAEILAKILLPAKNAVKMVESKSTTTADVFLFLIQMATAINALEKNSLPEHIEFRKQCIKFYNKRWKEFDIKIYLLAYFLHPKYRGKDYVSDEDDLDEIIDCENLDANEIIDFNIFTQKPANEINYNNDIEAEGELDYDINEVINATINNAK
ncbi:10935_t:CDS:2 [Racocetra fulgida]|uniref:10935_t:CDS:1 n=1 Tax=Racocetra fulgida TaxID=60492 RepID=A0A9N9GM15_9GLOM|nr:10935_t:CDS:2 [Racocetra fulgida]